MKNTKLNYIETYIFAKSLVILSNKISNSKSKDTVLLGQIINQKANYLLKICNEKIIKNKLNNISFDVLNQELDNLNFNNTNEQLLKKICELNKNYHHYFSLINNKNHSNKNTQY